MSLIFLCFTAVLLLVNLAGLALLLRPWIPHYALAKAAGVVIFCLLLFFIEHFVGLGRLIWLWPLCTALSLAMLYRWRDEFRAGIWQQELVFIVLFGVAMFWKYSFPDIDGHSEQLTDLAFITSYLSGVTLPPPDYWLPEQRLDFYYSFQHYGAALLGRILGLASGYAMNLASVVLLALIASMAWSVASNYCKPRWPRVVLVYAIMLGGTGIAPFTHFIIDQDKPGSDSAFTAITNIWANVRFAGTYDQDLNNSFISQDLFPKQAIGSESSPASEARDLPLETLSYLMVQGEYHAPQGGLLLLFLALVCLALLEAPKLDISTDAQVPPSVLQALFAATVPLTIITNAWVFPLQFALFAAWVIYRYARSAPPSWPAILLGGGATLALSYPFLSQFAPHALSTPITWVLPLDHTPPIHFIAIHWPVLVLLVLAIFSIRRQPLSALLITVFAGLLLASEVFYADDNMADKFNRFNSTLKWWSWIYPGILLGVGSILLSAGRWQRGITVTVLVLVSTLSIDVAAYWYFSGKSALGKFSGHHWLSKDQVDKQMLDWLKVAPGGVVLEGLADGGAYMSTSALSLFAGKPVAIGWPTHEAQWRGGPGFIASFADQARAFYHGNLTDAPAWLSMSHVRYIVWARSDETRDPAARQRIQEQIGGGYRWKAFWVNGADELGIWVRKE
ncbi:MAG: hypothetical protein HY273_14120 [Gammaproteobacteria bacterium]|nr:hypothetical protein [Gammaproteobacteria bacterium]